MIKGWLLIIGLLTCCVLNAQETFIKKTYFDDENTRLKEVVSLKKSDSTLHGPYQQVYENGSLAIEGYYSNDHSDSSWTYYFENGRIKATGSYKAGNQNGKWRYYYESGQIKLEGRFKNNTQHGQWINYFENGKEKSSGLYFEGAKEGIWNYFYEDGKLKAQAFFNGGKGQYREFYANGKLHAEGPNILDKSEGEWTYYHESGELEAFGNYSDGLKDGTWKYFHENAQLAAEGTFERGEKSGIWTYYFPDGSISGKGMLVNDQRDGFWKLYYPGGEIKGEGRFDQGTGEFVEYYASGMQKARGRLNNGIKEGEWNYYSEEGQEDGIAIFEEGVGDYRGFYQDGTLKMTGKIDNGKRVGKWTLYNPDGSVAGTYKPVYEDEKPIFRTRESLTEDDGKKGSDKPEYRYKYRKLRYFNPVINEYTGFILGTNPLWVLTGRLPISIEYYIQERLGYEAEISLHRQPFITYDQKKLNRLERLGVEVRLRQKFYNQDTELGMFYFGQQASFGYLRHHVDVLDSLTITPFLNETLVANESRYTYGIFVGNRWMQRAGDSGLTFDFNIGIGFGVRRFDKKYASFSEFDAYFDELNQESFYLPIIFTLNIGLAGPKRRSTSF